MESPAPQVYDCVMFWLMALVFLAVGFYLGVRAQRTEHVPLSFAPGVTRIELHLPAGRVRIHPAVGDATTGTRTFRYLFRRPLVTEEVVGEVLRIQGQSPTWADRGGFVEYELAIPAGASVKARTSAGALEVHGVAGDVSLQTGAGGIRVWNVSGPLSVRSSAGGIEGRGLKSQQLEAYGSAGSIDLSFDAAPTKVRIENHAGGIKVGLPEGPYDVHATTELGSARIQVPVAASSPSRIDARTSVGNIDIVAIPHLLPQS